MNPETRFARTLDGAYLAYQVSGDGPVDIVLLRGWYSMLEHEWDEPVPARILRRLGAMGRLIRFDRRGAGLSDRIVHGPDPRAQGDPGAVPALVRPPLSPRRHRPACQGRSGTGRR